MCNPTPLKPPLNFPYDLRKDPPTSCSAGVDDVASHEILLAQWQGIVPKIGCLFNTLKANYVPPFLIRQVFTQIFAFINVQLFNRVCMVMVTVTVIHLILGDQTDGPKMVR
ncbi:hypothetical protein L1987_45369 [Smallanthus sonchifolius]|uniref:Uncharacterized protein n=1 Tax=Smallanthus sonchifolius TaxID=185202 RepID=A0ACB9GRG5_9ASTR|nr:hypothetical protein L1987_45369 [Smallanthus sonchifolius]